MALAGQVRAVGQGLANSKTPTSAGELARRFRNVRTDRVSEILATLVTLGRARRTEDSRSWAS